MYQGTKKEWFLDRYCGYQFAALLEDGALTEFACEKEPRNECVGNIYKGVVTNVVPSLNAAFINCGLSKNCYLSMEESYTDYAKYDGTMAELNEKKPVLKEGDEVIVQMTQPSRGNKGAKVTMNLSFVGKRIIYLPTTSFLGISRKITNEEQRTALLQTAETMRESENEGFIIRTQAPFATQKQLETEAKYLKKLYAEVAQAAQSASVGAILYEDEDLPVRVIRDSFGESISTLHVGDEALYQRLLYLIRLQGDIPENKLIKYNGERSMLKEYGITPMLYDAARPTVPLKNGGSLVIEHTEAMTVIDVNTGSFVGKNNLEETMFAMNLAAAQEIAKQVRLRNIGGIIVVDFIDMAEEEHRVAVTEELKKCLALDNTKCNVLPMSELCITQFTRKRIGQDVLSYLVKPCAHCSGMGHVHDDLFVMTKIRSTLLDCFAEGYKYAVVDLNATIMDIIFSENIFSIEADGRWKENNIYFIPHKTYKEDYFTVRGEHDTPSNLPTKAKALK